MSWILFSQKLISYDLCTSFVFTQSEEDLWRFQVEAQEACTCKQILGLCHLPPQMEYQVKVEQKNPKSCREKMGSHESNGNRLKSLY